MEFREMPKMARLSREVVITEKLDGTNASVAIHNNAEVGDVAPAVCSVLIEGTQHWVFAGSRTRWVTPGANDNYGWATWVKENADELAKLGPGHHFGEWWGKGIQRGYGLTEKRFSLFNTMRWDSPEQLERLVPVGIHVVPVLYRGPMKETQPYIDDLKAGGSWASMGYMDPEGIVVYHMATRTMFKQTIDKDDEPKGKQE